MPLTRRAFRTLSSVTILLVAGVLLLVPFRAAAGVAPPLAAIAARDPVTAAWQRAQSSGVYHFATTVIETTHPAPTVANVGRSSTSTWKATPTCQSVRCRWFCTNGAGAS